ncbi:S-layer homology domain-containing protein [Lutibacter sp. B2]|nr:S-layer homology domain-containing protein [Lutibacter sp. B2]
MKSNKIIALTICMLMIFSCIPMNNISYADSQNQLNFQDLKVKFTKVVHKIATSEDARIQKVFGQIVRAAKGEMKIEVLIGILESDIELDTSEDRINSGESELYPYLKKEGIKVKQATDSLQLFNLFKIFTEDKRLAIINEMKAGNIPKLLDEENEILADIKAKIGTADYDQLVKDLPFDIHAYVFVLNALQSKLDKIDNSIVKDDENDANKIAIEIPTDVGGVSGIKDIVNKALKDLKIRGFEFTSIDEMNTIFVEKINNRLSKEKMEDLKIVLASYGLYEGKPVVEPPTTDGTVTIKGLPEGADGKTKPTTVNIPLNAEMKDLLGVDEINIELPSLQLTNGKLNIQIKKATQAEGIKKNNLAVEIIIEGLGTQQVTLTLPVPTNITNPGAFHGIGTVGNMRWEFRAATIKDGQITFTTSLSPVVIAEKIEVRTLKEKSKTTNSATFEWDSNVVRNYEVFNGETLLTTTSEKSYEATGLASNTTYNFKVRAIDTEGFESDYAQVAITTNKSSSGGGGGGGGGGSAYTGTIVKANEAATITREDATVKILANAFDKDIKVKITTMYEGDAKKLSISENTKLASKVFEIIKNEEGNFKKAVTITLPFEKADLEKYKLELCYYNEKTKEWVELENTKENKDTMSGEVNHFTKFAVIAIEKVPVPVDVKGHWAEENIMNLIRKGAVNGYEDGTFKPNNNITRAEFATILVKAFNLEAKIGTIFEDTKDHWAKDYIKVASVHGIVSGYNDTTFGPDELITREQMAVMIGKAANLNKSINESTFKDAKQISEWAKPYVAKANEAKFIAGYNDNTFKPKANAKRAEAMTIIANAIK